MGRYFFHVESAGEFYKDEVGRDFPNNESARANAVVIATQLSGDGKHDHGFEVCVMDESGREVARLQVKGDGLASPK